MSRVRLFLAILAIPLLYFILNVLVYFLAEWFMYYPPPRGSSDSMFSEKEGIKDCWIECDNLYIHARLYGDTSLPRMMIFAHGNAEDLESLHPFLSEYAKAGFLILAFDYSGYGKSEGKPSEKQLIKNALAVMKYVYNNQYLKKKEIIFHGRSLGTGVVLATAAVHPPAKIILESPFLSVLSVPFHYPVFLLDRFPSFRIIRAIPDSIPILIMHGEMDNIIPSFHSRRLYSLREKNTTMIIFPQTGHNDIFFRP